MKARVVGRGGGTRYPLILGAVRGMERIGLEISEWLGTSASAMVGGLLANGRSADEALEICRRNLPRDYLDWRFFSVWPFVDGTKGFIKGNKALEMFREHMPESFGQARLPLHVVVHNWSLRRAEVVTSGDLPLAVRKSMSLPIFDMVPDGGWLYEDGGVTANFLLDYEGWRFPTTSTSPMTIGLSPAEPQGNKFRQKPKHKFDRLKATLDDMMDALDREHIEDAHWAGVCRLESKHGSLELDMTAQDVDDMANDGERSFLKWADKHLITVS